ncbi:MAG: hypothetical protein Q9227_005453 [Pyrenula ochraceoflavens]
MEGGSGSGKHRDTDYGYPASGTYLSLVVAVLKNVRDKSGWVVRQQDDPMHYLFPQPNLEVDTGPKANFTFIEHNDNLITKRIRDPQARRAIRSHVMRDVRQREKLQGKKRGSKRDKADKEDIRSGDGAVDIKRELDSDVPVSPIVASPESYKTLSPAQWPMSPVATTSRNSNVELPSPGLILQEGRNQDEFESAFDEQTGGVGATEASSQLVQIRRSMSPSQGLIDPFDVLPGSIGHSQMTQRLVNYSHLFAVSEVFLPMTFPIDTRRSLEQQRLLVKTLMQDLRSDAAVFYAALTAAAGHNAIIRKRHEDLAPRPESGKRRLLLDPDYYVMEGEACRELGKKLNSPDGLSHHAFQSILSLIGATSPNANKDSVCHREFRQDTNAPRRTEANDSFPRGNDIKAAMGLNSRPILPIFWDRQNLTVADHERIRPPSNSILNYMATKFDQIPGLSSSLLSLLEGLRNIYFLHDLGIRNDTSLGLGQEDYQLFSRKCTEFEYDLLEYPWQQYGDDESALYNMHPLERVVRTTILDLLKNSFVVALPASGLGRASTTSLVKALVDYNVEAFAQMYPAVEELLMWAYLIGVPGAKEYPEEEIFLDRLATIVSRRPGLSFDRLVELCAGFVYVPSLMEANWRESWTNVQRRIGVMNSDTVLFASLR